MLVDEKHYDNDLVIDSFSQEEKDELFQNIMSMYFRKNFGSLSKADMETYLFSFYYEHVLIKQMDVDDYTIGRDLGLTISRVRGLKERKELKYPHKGYEWTSEFLKYAQNAKYDEVHHLMKFSIPDVNVIKDVRYYFEKNNQYDEVQLNPKLFACKTDIFFEMCKQIAKENNEEFSFDVSNCDELKRYLDKTNCSEKEIKGIKKILQGTVEDGLKDLLIGASKETLLFVLSLVNPGAGAIANKLFDIVKYSLER